MQPTKEYFELAERTGITLGIGDSVYDYYFKVLLKQQGEIDALKKFVGTLTYRSYSKYSGNR